MLALKKNTEQLPRELLVCHGHFHVSITLRLTGRNSNKSWTGLTTIWAAFTGNILKAFFLTIISLSLGWQASSDAVIWEDWYFFECMTKVKTLSVWRLRVDLESRTARTRPLFLRAALVTKHIFVWTIAIMLYLKMKKFITGCLSHSAS